MRSKSRHIRGRERRVSRDPEYKWPALIVGREGTQVKVKLFNKNKGILVDPDDVSDFVYMDHTNSNNELKNGFKMALTHQHLVPKFFQLKR